MKAVSGREMCRILQGRGWELKRISGSHHTFRQAGNPTIITVPVHGNQSMKTGTQRSIMRAAGLTDDDL